MAAIDKIYVNTWKQYLEFKDWCEKQSMLEDKYGKKVSLTEYLYHYEVPFEKTKPAFMAPCYVDAYIIRNCPLDFIQKELMVNYGHNSDDIVKDMYDTVMGRGGKEGTQGEDCWYWLTKDDFKIIDGKVTYPANEESTYSKIKRGEMLTSPVFHFAEFGKHFRCIRHPKHKYNYPIKGWWSVSVDIPDEIPQFMWYHSNHNSWDFSDDFVIADWSSSDAHVRSIKALQRMLTKRWKLPVGTIVRATGRYVNEIYEFVITK